MYIKATPKARVTYRGNTFPTPKASTSPNKPNKVILQVYRAAAAINGTEAHLGKKADDKSGIKRAVNTYGSLVVSVEYLTYMLDALMYVTPFMLSNMSKRAFDVCCRYGSMEKLAYILDVTRP